MLNVKEPNNYGRRTFEIEISPSYVINIVEVEGKEKIVRLLDKGLIWTETEFEVTTNKCLIEALKFSFYKSRSHINKKDGNEWKRRRFKSQLKKTISIIDEYAKSVEGNIDARINPRSNDKKENEGGVTNYYKEIKSKIGKKEALFFFQENNIDLKKFYSNYNELSGSPISAYIKVENDLEPTESIGELYKSPPAYPLWYSAAFPDVVLWTMEAIEADDEGVSSMVENEVEALERGEQKRLSDTFLKYILGRYKENNSLECSK